MYPLDQHLKAGHTGVSLNEALQLRCDALLGVTEPARLALEAIGIRSLFDLGAAWQFANADQVLASPAGGPPGQGGVLVDAAAPPPGEDASSLPLASLRGLSAAEAATLSQALGVGSIREFALWPPRLVARRLLSEATGGGALAPDDPHAEALRPRLGEYPTERVYYDSLVMLGIVGNGQGQPLSGAISLQAASGQASAFDQPAIGAVVTLAQSWYAKGITLGHMLHSLALAPGEATRIAVVDWSRRTRASTSESIDESERLDSAVDHSRAISEVQNAVASEMQSGGSMSSGWAKSTSKGKAGGFSIGGGLAGMYKGVTGVLGFGGGSGSSRQESETTSEASSTSWSVGNRSVMAELSQRVNDRTEQHSTSVRNRRASAVREVSQSEHEQVSTRVVANYNHMHALTVQYYEVIQVYRVTTQVHAVQRVLFLPFELLDFGGPDAMDLVARHRAALLEAAINPRIAGLLMDERGEVEIRAASRVPLPLLVSEALLGSPMAIAIATAPAAAPAAAPAGSPAAALSESPVATRIARRSITSPGPVVDRIPGDAVLSAIAIDGVAVDRLRFDEAGVAADANTFSVPASTGRIDFPNTRPLRTITGIHVAKGQAEADAGTLTLLCEARGEQYAVTVPIELAAGTGMQRVAYVSADAGNRKQELLAHLQSNRAHYSQAVLRRLDSATLVLLLSRFHWQGKPLADQVEPKPLAVAGNYLVLKAPIEGNEPAGLSGSSQTWSDLLEDRALTSLQRNERLVPIPTGGVFAEAVLGRSNSAEKLDITRFWNWQDSPIPLQPPEIAPVATGSRATPEDLRAGALGAPVLNIVNPTALPDPGGAAAVLGAVANGGMFRDMSGLAGTQALAEAASANTLTAATEAGRLASTNYKTATDQAVAMGQAAADMWKVAQQKSGSGGGPTAPVGPGTNPSTAGALINHGRDMDDRGVGTPAPGGTGLGGLGAKPAVLAPGGQAGQGGSTDVMPPAGVFPWSNERNYSDTLATGVSPAAIGGLQSALLGNLPSPGAVIGTLGNIAAALPDALVLLVIQSDLAGSPFPTQGLALKPMGRHRIGADLARTGYLAWTHSATDIYVNTDALLADISNSVAGGMSLDNAIRRARGIAMLGLLHEIKHTTQFATAGGPPADYVDMLRAEIVAYGGHAGTGCASQPAPPAGSSLHWLADPGPTGARAYLTGTLGLPSADAATLVTEHVTAYEDICRILCPLAQLPVGTTADRQATDRKIFDAMVAKQLLPDRLLKGAHKGYKITDLYLP